ncbi:radical SAM protein [Myxococcus sp. K15C18031901]|uniref:radical SAM protein n=1 Tax=Myxococcus dinghuensis TaxID=2906761 RepID=UPI0020A708D2|nr:radical SAM protein [Myxococcus dinghuensis]MCP3097890.1 radical SAM protein [Myxococcus dinghuensis]
METAFVAFIPLSNWLRGFDRYRMRYSKASISESTFPDAFYMLKEDEPWAPGLAKARRLVAKLGRAKDRVVALRAQLPTSGAQAMRPNDTTGTGIGWRWPAPEVPLSGVAWVGDDDTLRPTFHEEVTAQAFLLDDTGLVPWADCRPRSFSVLPVAKACQATCAFCFSKASVSDLARQRSASLEQQLEWADLARERGAERAVITGGGEPTLLPPTTLRSLVRGLAERFPKTLLITNGARLDAGHLRALRDEGLTTLALSRHGVTPEDDARIMGLSVDAGALARAFGLRSRAICVLQRGGVDDVSKVLAYLERSARDGFDEVCFKELYVSSLSENPWAPSAVNRYCETHQVPLGVVLRAMDAAGFTKVAELPWGSPVFEGEVAHRVLRVAAYTEPSVGWERTHRLVRSWNLMSDGTCMASLEDPASEVRR